MAGRAGRRGLDSQGYAVLMLSHWLAADEGEAMLSRRYADLCSQFALRFSTYPHRGAPTRDEQWPKIALSLASRFMAVSTLTSSAVCAPVCGAGCSS